ncbi:unnamed protein product [Euphydryas editha]|uniref:Uncharacterized protein n=1 Tax=Euphydryas editha TaxID=104508 RepID=A0AAU9UM71_EUPED|nr:unnamed protein product [Euphydryas editha]
MAKDNFKATTVTEMSLNDRYKKCTLLNTIQHIDIMSRKRSSYIENRKYLNYPVSISSVSCSPKLSECSTRKDLEGKLSKLSVTTKVSGLYPGHDILSKKYHRYKQTKLKK